MRYFTDPPENESENFVLPCGTCSKRVGKRMRAVQCDICNFWNHIKCDNIDPKYSGVNNVTFTLMEIYLKSPPQS